MPREVGARDLDVPAKPTPERKRQQSLRQARAPPSGLGVSRETVRPRSPGVSYAGLCMRAGDGRQSARVRRRGSVGAPAPGDGGGVALKQETGSAGQEQKSGPAAAVAG